MRKLTLNGKVVQDDSDCYVIAEIGHNHQGKLETAKELFRVAKECGADASATTEEEKWIPINSSSPSRARPSWSSS